MLKLARTARELVHKHGGATKYCKATGTPIGTAKQYSTGRRNMPEYLVRIIDYALIMKITEQARREQREKDKR